MCTRHTAQRLATDTATRFIAVEFASGSHHHATLSDCRTSKLIQAKRNAHSEHAYDMNWFDDATPQNFHSLIQLTCTCRCAWGALGQTSTAQSKQLVQIPPTYKQANLRGRWPYSWFVNCVWQLGCMGNMAVSKWHGHEWTDIHTQSLWQMCERAVLGGQHPQSLMMRMFDYIRNWHEGNERAPKKPR